MFITDSELKSRLHSERNFLKPDSIPEDSIPEDSFEQNSNESHNSEDSNSVPLESNLEIESHKFRGRHAEIPNLPDFMRPIIAASGILCGTKTTAEEFGISRPMVSAMKDGRPHNAAKKDETLISQTEVILGDSRKKAADIIFKSLGFIDDDEKLKGARLGDLSKVAADMSRIIEKTQPRAKESEGTKILIYAPQIRNENSYEIVESV